MAIVRKKFAFDARESVIPSSVSQAVEDAILFGHVKEIDAVLDLVENDKDFPEELRYGLQALRYFRAHYGKDGMIEPGTPLQQQKAIVVETAWGSELLDLLRHGEHGAMEKRA